MSTTNLTNSSSDPQLPTESPPLPPGLPNQNQSTSNPLNTTQIAPTVGSLPASYQNYYQYQYMQYYQQYMYSHPTIMQSYGMMPPAQPTAPNYYNYNPAPSQQQPVAPKQTAQSLTAPQVPPNAASQQKSSILIEEQKSSASNETPKPAIKINLKYQQGSNNNQINSSVSSPMLSTSVETSSDKITPRRSRFDDKVSNVTSQQKKFEQQQKEIESKEKETKTDESKNEGISSNQTNSDNIATSSQSEIVFDIHKWPIALKNYCAKVYQHYQSISLVSEDQVTKYLQQRITDAFKVKPDLNIGWENEPLPDIISIRKVAPFSQQQLQRQKQLQQQKINEAKAALAAAAANKNLQSPQVQQKQNNITSNIKNKMISNKEATKVTKRKIKGNNRSSSSTSSKSDTSSSKSSSSSRSRSSSSSSTSSDENSEFVSSLNPKKKKKDEKQLVTFKKSIFTNKRKLVPFEVSSGLKNFNLDSLQKSEDYDDDNSDEDVVLTKKQKKNKAKLNNKQKNFKNNGQFSKKFLIENNKVSRKILRSIFELEREKFDNSSEINDLEQKKKICIGTNQDLEKEYLRLTGPPESSMIRPVWVLKRSLEFVLNKYYRTNDYRYVCDQLKAIRQDLTVQMIQNEFTIEVYETHARIAIRNKDRDEFNQCQNQLKNLYNLVLKTGNNREVVESSNCEEFIGYRLLYNMMTKSYKDINQVINEIKNKYPNNSYLKHLIKLKNAWHLNNYVKFFSLYSLSNELSRNLIDLFIERERKNALKIIIKSYRPSIKLDYIREILAYESLQKCKDDLISYKLCIQSVNVDETATSNNLDFKNSIQPKLELILDCKSCNIQNL